MERADTKLCAGTSKNLFNALGACVCSGACMASCSNDCLTGVRDNTCQACVGVGACAADYNACLAD